MKQISLVTWQHRRLPAMAVGIALLGYASVADARIRSVVLEPPTFPFGNAYALIVRDHLDRATDPP
jgi:hypothetical protein